MKVIAYVLPQFHRIPENDEWWGKGFTEWTNTRKARPLFTGHYQPREPFQDFYYDLTDPEVRKWQANIAQNHGVYGFCYYHYWSSGKMLLERPVNDIIRLGEPDFPFCLCWANHTWNRSWTHEEDKVLMLQTYGDQSEWKLHFDYLLTAFLDPRYIKVNNKPMFLIYRPKDIEGCKDRLQYWNQLAQENGFDGMYFVETLHCHDPAEGCEIPGFNAMVEFEPLYTIKYPIQNPVHYDTLWQTILNRSRPEGKTIFLGAFPGWDNTARKQDEATIVVGSTPKKFGRYVAQQIENAKRIPNSDFLFINAWNEWAEGAYLEPDKRYEFKYLEYLAKAVKGDLAPDRAEKDYRGDYDTELLELVEPSAEIILHVGCGCGELGRAIKQRSKTVVYGITDSDLTAQQAEENLDFVLCGKWEVLQIPFANNTFDEIILEGVFEEAVEPRRVLQRFLPFLKPNGKLIVSIVNVGHISTITNLLQSGKWQYSGGTLKKQPLRFYTLREMQKLVETAGLHIRKTLTQKPLFTPDQSKYAKYLKENYKRLQIESVGALEEMAVEKYFFEISVVYEDQTKRTSVEEAQRELAQYKAAVKTKIESIINEGMFDEARSLLEEYSILAADDPDIYSFHAVMLIMEERFKEAETILLQGLTSDANNFDLLYNLAFVYQKQENWQEAAARYQHALSFAPTEELKDQIASILNEVTAYVSDPTVAARTSELGGNWFEGKDSIIEAEELIAKSGDTFASLVKKAEDAWRINDCDEVAEWAQQAADYAHWHHAGLFSSPTLEMLLQHCAKSLTVNYPVSVIDIPNKVANKKNVLHILSQSHFAGGHSRLVKRWIELDSANSAHSIVVTLNSSTTPQWLTDSALGSGGWYYPLDQDKLSLCQRAKVLRDMTNAWADLVVVHAHPHDPIPVMTFGIDGGPPVICLNHADHAFWLGLSVADSVVNIRQTGQRLAWERRRARNLQLLPIPLEFPNQNLTREEARQQLGIDRSAIVLLSIASPYKYSQCGQFDFLSTLQRLVTKHPQTIALVVGPENEGRWREVYDASNGRIRALGMQEDLSLFHRGADIYMDSFPIGSITAALEAGIYGLPVVGLSESLAPILQNDDISFRKVNSHVWNVDTYEHEVEKLILDEELRSLRGNSIAELIGRDHITEWKAGLDKIIDSLPPSHSATNPEEAVLTVSASDLVWAYFQYKAGLNQVSFL